MDNTYGRLDMKVYVIDSAKLGIVMPVKTLLVTIMLNRNKC